MLVAKKQTVPVYTLKKTPEGNSRSIPTPNNSMRITATGTVAARGVRPGNKDWEDGSTHEQAHLELMQTVHGNCIRCLEAPLVVRIPLLSLA